MKKSKLLICVFTTFISAAALADKNDDVTSTVQHDLPTETSISTSDSSNFFSELFDSLELNPLGTTRDTGETRPMPDEDDGIPPRGRMCPNWPYCENYENN